jgi:hypothetical protein
MLGGVSRDSGVSAMIYIYRDIRGHRYQAQPTLLWRWCSLSQCYIPIECRGCELQNGLQLYECEANSIVEADQMFQRNTGIDPMSLHIGCERLTPVLEIE